jgi:hypothetical protein
MHPARSCQLTHADAPGLRPAQPDTRDRAAGAAYHRKGK